MLKLTKIFHFEMAHAIHGYSGACKDIHGHSYELHVTVSYSDFKNDYIPSPGFIVDFKELKKMVNAAIVEKMDHGLLLSESYIAEHPSLSSSKNLIIFDAEPTAENLLLHIKQLLNMAMPVKIKLVGLKLFETKDSYAEWAEDVLSEN